MRKAFLNYAANHGELYKTAANTSVAIRRLYIYSDIVVGDCILYMKQATDSVGYYIRNRPQTVLGIVRETGHRQCWVLYAKQATDSGPGLHSNPALSS